MYTVYKHTTPSNKFYFGITNSTNLNKRWANGLGYRTQKVFFRAIVKYGWDNIKHEVVKDNLSLDEAKSLEIFLIEKYRTDVSKFGHNSNGYNMTSGGDNIPSIFYQEDDNYKKTMDEKVYSKTRISVDCYDFVSRKYLKTYKSLGEAASELKINKNDISKNINHKTNRVSNYIFVKHGEKPKEFTGKYFKRPVFQFDINGKFLRMFDSCADASRYINNGSTNGSSMIAKCAKGERKSYKGFLWKYDNL